MTDEPKVFISYRRADASGHAGRLYSDTAERFGDGSIFMDVTLGPGIPFVERITQAVGACRVLLVVIGRQWASIRDDAGAQRLANPRDYVRLEVETALERPEIEIIPVLVDGATMPDPEQLPEKLRPLALLNAHEMSDRRWPYDSGLLINELERRISGARVVSSTALLVQGLLVAFAAGLLANWLVSELMPSPAEQDTEAAGIAISVARRAEAWALVGAALGGWLAYARGGWIAVRAALGLLLGALAGALGGLVDAIPDIANREPEAWIDALALATTGAIVGALVGGSWQRPHAAIGALAGAGAGLIVEALLDSPQNPGESALRVTLIAGLVVIALVAADAARRSTAEAGPRLSWPQAR